MERVFRKYFWTINLVFIALVALLAARTVNVFLESAIAPVTASRGRSTSHAAAAPPRTPLNLEMLAAMVGLPLPAPEPEVVEPTRPSVDLDSEPVKSSLRVRLLGTLISGVKEWSFASIQDVVSQKAGTFMVGMQIQGAQVLDIERSRVIVLNNGRREFINGEAGSGEAVAYTPPMPRPSDAPPSSSATGSGIKAVDDSHYEVPRAEIDKTLSNLNDVAMQARIVPAFKDGVAQGFKLFSIRPDSIYTKIGIQNGDVIRRINGYDLNSPEKALEIYSKLKEASRIDIEVERNGAVLQKTYNVR
ncbi:MAG TPA: type II secretion system protein GspC [Myxococcaceae bacterium]|jgi:general secretion pathway protein C